MNNKKLRSPFIVGKQEESKHNSILKLQQRQVNGYLLTIIGY